MLSPFPTSQSIYLLCCDVVIVQLLEPTSWVQILVLPLTSYVNLDTLFHLSEPQFPHLHNGGTNNPWFMGLMQGLNEVTHCPGVKEALSKRSYYASVIAVVSHGTTSHILPLEFVC